jgi:NAD(P)-dependent dehydrogenase (short-subunit alcohol dehydrogenase family)
MSKDLTGKVALITGAASGIGKATAELFAHHGAKLMLADIDTEGGEALAATLQSLGNEVVFRRVDVSRPEECQAMVEAVIASYGQLDIGFNNAGIMGELRPLAEQSSENWRKLMGVNLDSVFYCMKYEIEYMVQNGGGAIVNTSSICGAVATPGCSPYVASKHAVAGLTKTAAIEYAPHGIRINAVGPGVIQTPLITRDCAAQAPEGEATLVAMTPLGRIGQPREVAELVLWLSSDQASFATGGYYPIDGGYLAQ